MNKTLMKHAKIYDGSGSVPFFGDVLIEDDRIAKIAESIPAEDDFEIVELDGGGLRVDLTARIVYLDGERVEMSPKEYELFFYLLRNRNVALTREKLISEVWGYDFYGDDRTLDTHIKLLRRSLGEYASRITTLRGVGYRFEKE